MNKTKLKYTPHIAVEILKNQNIWDNKIFKIVDNMGWKNFYKKIEQLNDYKYNANKSMMLGIKIGNIMVKRASKNKKYYSLIDFIQNDFNKTIEIYDFVNYVCLKYDVNFPQFIRGFVLIELLFLSAASKFIKKDYRDTFYLKGIKIDFDKFPIRELIFFKDVNNLEYKIRTVSLKAIKKNKLNPKSFNKAVRIVYQNFFKILHQYNDFLKNPLNYPFIGISKLVEITIDKAQDIELNLKYKPNEMKLDKNVIYEDLELIRNVSFYIQNKKIFNYALNNPDHYLNIILQDEIEVDVSKNEPEMYLKNFYNGLTYGTYEKGIYFGSYKYKRELINYLKQAKDILENFTENDLKEEQIKIIDELIDFLNQDKRVASYITFKEIAKHTGASKNQIKSLIKKLLSNEKAKNFEKLLPKISSLNTVLKG
jgi:hypothetical protein